MRKEPEYVEGTQAWARFQGGMKRVLSVSHEEMQRRLEAQRKASEGKPKRGPKLKAKA